MFALLAFAGKDVTHLFDEHGEVSLNSKPKEEGTTYSFVRIRYKEGNHIIKSVQKRIMLPSHTYGLKLNLGGSNRKMWLQAKS